MTFGELKQQYTPVIGWNNVDEFIKKQIDGVEQKTMEIYQVQNDVRSYVRSVEDVLELVNDDTAENRMIATSLLVSIKTYLELFLEDLTEISW